MNASGSTAMTLAYCAKALNYDAERIGYALRPDYDPGLHRVDIECCQAMGWSTHSDAGWNDPADPPIAHVRNMYGVPIHAGHAYVADRFNVTGPDSAMIRIDLLEIDHDPVGIVSGAPLEPGFVYRVANCANPYRTQKSQRWQPALVPAQ